MPGNIAPISGQGDLCKHRKNRKVVLRCWCGNCGWTSSCCWLRAVVIGRRCLRAAAALALSWLGFFEI